MTLAEELRLSYYKTVAEIDADHKVWLVQHTETEKFYVKKELALYNIEVMRSLQSYPVRNTPTVYEIAEDDNKLTVIEEYLAGDNLQEILDRDGPFDEEMTVSLILQLCQIVSELHHRDPAVIHRDIKPSNLIISPDGVLKLIDFGSARFASSERNRDTVLLGTAGYAAPEQYGFGSSSAQTDLYAVGVVMNVLLTGCLPSEAMAEGKLSVAVRGCTRLDPEDRFHDVDELAGILESYTETSSQEDSVIASAAASEVTPDRLSWRRFLPPGFRTGKLWKMLLAIMGYIMILGIIASPEPEGEDLFSVIKDKTAELVMMLSVVLFSADYLGIQSKFPFTRSKNRLIRIAGIVFWDFCLVFLIALILNLIR